MSANIDLSGLNRLRENLESLSKQGKVPLLELLSSQFVASCSKYSIFEELLEASPFSVKTAEDFLAIPNDEWDAYIAKGTSYSSWKEMQAAAMEAYAKNKLLSGL